MFNRYKKILAIFYDLHIWKMKKAVDVSTALRALEDSNSRPFGP